jgi:hypothetical protein
MIVRKLLGQALDLAPIHPNLSVVGANVDLPSNSENRDDWTIPIELRRKKKDCGYKRV